MAKRPKAPAATRPLTPAKEMGTSGTAVFSGYIQSIETHPRLQRGVRYRTAAELLANVAIISAGMRFFMNLMAKPAWTMVPAGEDDATPEAVELAEFMQSVIGDLTDNWARVIRRAGLYRFHGFGVQEWTAKRRPDGRIGLKSIEIRPSFTIERWHVADTGEILGVWQKSPQTGQQLYIPRAKFLYLVDDAFTDSPEGMGLFRSLVDDGDRYIDYQRFESQGFERDMSGIPVGKAPITEIQAKVEAGTLSQAQADAMLAGVKAIVQTQSRKPNTGFLYDSEPYRSDGANGTEVSAVQKWGLDLLRGESPDFERIGRAIERLRFNMAMVLGVEGLLLGATESGSRALSTDKSINLYLAVNGAMIDLAQAVKRDIVGPVWRLNGFPEELMPTPVAEDITFRDIVEEAGIIRELANAGAVLDVEDPIIDWFRTRIGAPATPELRTERPEQDPDAEDEGAGEEIDEQEEPEE